MAVRNFLAGFASCILLIVAVGALGKAFSCDWLVASVASHHYGKGSDKDYEQRNWGLGCEHRLTKNLDFVAGFYRNSVRIDSTYVGVVYAPLRFEMLRFGLATILVSGYEREPIKAAFPVASIEGRRMGANLLLVPQTSSNVGAIGLQLKVRF
jgi:hypothetical protein